MNENSNAALEMDDHDDGEQFLTFKIANEEYAIDILKVQEIKGWGEVTPIPCSPAHVLGVINLRGVIVPVVDLRVKFNLPAKEHSSTTAIIIVRSEVAGRLRIIGLVVDEVAEVYSLNENNIQESDGMSSTVGGNYIRGLGVLENKMLIIIHLDEIVISSIDEIPDDLELNE